MNDSVLQLWQGVLFRQRPDSTLEWIGSRIQQWTGLEPHRTLEALHPADRAKLTEENAVLRLRHTRTGRITWVQQRRQGFEGYWEDITEHVSLKHQIAQAHWKATLGAATNKLVHDFNNLLTGVLSLSDAYLLKIEPDNPAHEGFTLLNRQARQAADIVQQIARLFREIPGKPSYHNLCELAVSIADMLQYIVPRHTSVQVQSAGDCIPVYVDAVALKQVVVSLVIAAAPATIVLGTGLPARLHLSLPALDQGSPALTYAQRFAERSDAEFVASKSGFTFSFRLAEFSDAEAARPLSILLIGRENKALFKVADLFRHHSYEVVVGGDDFMDLLRSPDYRFDGVWMRSEEAVTIPETLREHFPALKHVVSAASAPEEMLAELRGVLEP